MTESSTIYCIDTSALIDGLERYYPMTSFPKLWKKIDELISSKRLIMSEEAWNEACEKDAAAKEWCEARDKNALCHLTDREVAVKVQDILKQFKKIVGGMKGRNRADPFVLAVAKIRNATVVTGEGDDGSANRPKIPYICGEMKIPCIRFLDIIKLENWKF